MKKTISYEISIGRDTVSVNEYINGKCKVKPLLVGTNNNYDIAMACRKAAMELLMRADAIHNGKEFFPVTDINKQIEMMLSENEFTMEGEPNE